MQPLHPDLTASEIIRQLDEMERADPEWAGAFRYVGIRAGIELGLFQSLGHMHHDGDVWLAFEVNGHGPLAVRRPAGLRDGPELDRWIARVRSVCAATQ